MAAIKLNTVVLIESEHALLKALNIELLRAGYVVYCATNGKTGIALTHRVKPALVILETLLPDMDGCDAICALKKDAALRAMRVMVFSHLDERSDREKALACGADVYLHKASATIADFLTHVRRVLV